jgi:Ca2+-binding EF-hand superfamily protein
MESFETIRKLDEGDEDGEIGDPLRPSTRKGPTTSEALSSEIKQKIQEAFKIFDHENNNTVDVREIGTIIRSLGFCPSEGELQEVLRDMEDPQQVGYIQFDRFYPEMSKIIIQHK